MWFKSVNSLVSLKHFIEFDCYKTYTQSMVATFGKVQGFNELSGVSRWSLFD